MDFDEALDKVGGFNRYQFLMLISVLASEILSSCLNVGYVFLAFKPESRCRRVPDGNGRVVNVSFTENYRNASTFSNATGVGDKEECIKAIYNRSQPDLHNFKTETVIFEPCEAWIYDQTYTTRSLVTEVIFYIQY